MSEVSKVLPSPKKDEAEKDFVARFMGAEDPVKEFPDRKQRFAVAMSMWRKHLKEVEKRLALWGSTAGKTRVAQKTVAKIPAHKIYVEPFAGGAAVFYAKPKEMSELEVLSDTHPEIAFSFKFIRDLTEDQAKEVRAKNWMVSKEQAKRVHYMEPKTLADRFYRFVYKRYAMFYRNESRITAIDPAKAGKKPTLIDKLEQTKERLKGIKVHNSSYADMVKAYDGKDTFFYFDPPYPRIAQEVGENAFDEKAFITMLGSIKGKFLLHYDYRDKKKFLNKGYTVKVISVYKTGGGTEATVKGKLLEVTNYVPTKKDVASNDTDVSFVRNLQKNKEYVITVVSTPEGNKYAVNGSRQSTLQLEPGATYTFDQTSRTNRMHPLELSTTANGIHEGGEQYTEGWSDNGGSAGTTLVSTFKVPEDAPAGLYYYCRNHVGMGGKIKIAKSPTRKAEPGSSEDDADQSQPARPDERRTGSRRNPRGSAATEGGKIELSPTTNKTLQTKLDAHNDKVGDDKSKRTTLRALQAVYRRGAGAFSVSHRPGMTRAQWAFARVNHFLHLLETGKPKDPKYITDNDLLPEGHPAVKKSEGFVPPKEVRDQAEMGLELRREWGRGGLSVQQAAEEGIGSGVQRAVNLKNGDRMSLDSIRRMRGFFSRHERNFKPEKKMPDGGPTAGTIAWYLWGGTPGRKWADKIWNEVTMKKQTPAHFGGGENINIFGYETKHFDICRSAVILFRKMGKAQEEQTQKHIVKAAKYLDEFFGLEKKVVEANAASSDDAETAVDLSTLFAYEVGIIAERMGRSFDRDIVFVKMHFNEIGSRMTPEVETEKYELSETDTNADLSWTMPFLKKDDEERIVTGIVLEPEEVDAQGDIVSEEAIKEAAYRFLAKFNKDTELGFMHKAFGDLGMSLVESWIARQDTEMGGNPVKKGSWVMSVRIDKNDALWEKVKEGKISGFSIGGVARVSG